MRFSNKRYCIVVHMRLGASTSELHDPLAFKRIGSKRQHSTTKEKSRGMVKMVIASVIKYHKLWLYAYTDTLSKNIHTLHKSEKAS